MDSFSEKLGKPIWNSPVSPCFVALPIPPGPGSRPMAPKTMLKFSCEWSVTWESKLGRILKRGFWLGIFDDYWWSSLKNMHILNDDHLLKKKKNTWLSNTFDLTAILTVFECVWLWQLNIPSIYSKPACQVHERHCSTCHAVLYSAPHRDPLASHILALHQGCLSTHLASWTWWSGWKNTTYI